MVMQKYEVPKYTLSVDSTLPLNSIGLHGSMVYVHRLSTHKLCHGVWHTHLQVQQ